MRHKPLLLLRFLFVLVFLIKSLREGQGLIRAPLWPKECSRVCVCVCINIYINVSNYLFNMCRPLLRYSNISVNQSPPNKDDDIFMVRRCNFIHILHIFLLCTFLRSSTIISFTFRFLKKKSQQKVRAIKNYTKIFWWAEHEKFTYEIR